MPNVVIVNEIDILVRAIKLPMVDVERNLERWTALQGVVDV